MVKNGQGAGRDKQRAGRRAAAWNARLEYDNQAAAGFNKVAQRLLLRSPRVLAIFGTVPETTGALHL
jgi:hypothetical protein